MMMQIFGVLHCVLDSLKEAADNLHFSINVKINLSSSRYTHADTDYSICLTRRQLSSLCAYPYQLENQLCERVA